MIIIEPFKKFSQSNLKFVVDSGNVSGTGVGSCVISIIFNLAVSILI